VRNHSSHFSSPSIRRSFHASPRFERLRPRTIEARARNQRIAAFRGVFHPVHIESPRQTRACSGRRTARVQPKPTRSTAPIAKDVDAAFDRAINADKLKRYALFDTVSRGGTQRADGWYQDNVEPAVTCAREERAGPAGEGGKWLCDPNRLRARGADCLIYSVGSFDDFSFEEAITRDVSSAREIHAFDHTVSNPRNKPCGVHFHPLGLGGAREPDGSDLKGLADIVVALGHKGRTIDVLKIDCEGCEWSTYGSWFDADVRVDEMLVEIHAGTIDSNLNEIHQSWLSLIVGEQLFGRGALDPSREPVAKRFLRRLYDENFYIFHKEPNIKYSRLHKMCVEFALIRFDGGIEGVENSPNS
jgi:hypothetical protein